MTVPAVVSWAAEQKWISSRGRALTLLKSKKSVTIVTALAIGELVVDKLPFAPNRTEPFSLAVRALSGGLSAGALCAANRKLVVAGAVVGGVAAIAGAFAGYQARRQLRERLRWNDKAIAVAEDALAIGGGLLLVRSA